MTLTGGWKTYALAGLLAAVFFVELLGIAPEGTTDKAAGILSPLMGATVIHKLLRSDRAKSMLKMK